jgi:hypothetical protein
MTFFSFHQNSDLKKRLKLSAQDFKFGQRNLKSHLLQSLELQKPLPELAKATSHRMLKIVTTTSGVVILLSGTFAFASTSNPGDKLFGLNKFGERIILSLPFSATQKANIETGIVERRFKALDNLNQPTNTVATIKESDEALSEAVATITLNRENFLQQGNTQQANQMGLILNKLDSLAKQREQRIQNLEDGMENENDRAEIQRHLIQFQNTRKQAEMEIEVQFPN